MPVQSTDIVVASGNALTFTASTGWFIAPHVLVHSDLGVGVFSDFDSSTVSNFGTIDSGVGAGVALGGAKSIVENWTGGTISGGVAIVFRLPDGKVFNSGALISRFGEPGLGAAAAKDADEPGIAIDALQGGLSLINTGLVVGDVQSAMKAADTVNNTGTIIGDIRLGGGSDLYDGRGGLVQGEVNGGSGDDRLLGGDQDDVLVGCYGDDEVRGGRGDDTITGGPGKNLLSGGSGDDSFVFAHQGTVDRVRGFRPGEDAIHLDNDAFLGLGGAGGLTADAFRLGRAAADDEDRVIYNAKTGVLKLDLNGDDAGGVTKIAKLAPGLDLTHEHFDII